MFLQVKECVPAAHAPHLPPLLTEITSDALNFYAWVCGAILARAHARTGDLARIAGYCGKSEALDDALAQWAEHCGDQTEEDHAKLLASIKRGETKADIQPEDGS